MHNPADVAVKLSSVEEALKEGRLSDAERLCTAAAEQHPSDARAKLMLGVIASLSGDIERAISLSQEAVDLSPEFPEASLQLLSHLRKVGRLEQAVETGRAFIALVPSNAAVWNYVGVCQFELIQYDEAAKSFQQAVLLDGANLQYRQNLAKAARELGGKEGSARIMREAITDSQSEPEERLRTARLLLAEGNTENAIEVYREALKGLPNSFQALFELGNLLLITHSSAEEALAILQQALKIDPTSADAYVSMGRALQALGRFDEAITVYNHVLAIEPGQAVAYLQIVASKKVNESDRPLLERMADLLKREDLTDRNRRYLHYAVSKAHDSLGEYELALAHCDDAARITIDYPAANSIPFDARLENQRVNWAIDQFTREFFQRYCPYGLKTELPILIVGAPRSGTTLLEQMLSGHPEAAAAGELLFWHRNSADALRAITSDRAKATEIALKYKQLLKSFGAKKKRVIDKYPMNYSALGVIHALFPNARIIHCRRHPVDTCLSLYLSAADMSQVPFGHSREDIVQGYRVYLRHMQLWRETLPADRFIDIDYESLVTDRETTLRGLTAFCGLEWDEACLHHETNEREVSTPSRWQVGSLFTAVRWPVGEDMDHGLGRLAAC